MNVVFDTLRYANALKEAGVDPIQAEAMASALNAEILAQLATKDDINDLNKKIAGVHSHINRTFWLLTVGLTVGFGFIGIMIASTTLASLIR